MNSVPFAFYDELVLGLRYNFVTTTALCDLDGLAGAVASDLDKKWFYEKFTINNGQIVCSPDDEFEYYEHYRLVTEIWFTETVESDDDDSDEEEEERPTDPKTIEGIRSYRNLPKIVLAVFTSAISKEIEMAIDSLKFVTSVHFASYSSKIIARMMRKLVPKKTLTDIEYHDDDWYTDETATLLLDLLNQEQFSCLVLKGQRSSTLLVRKIIALWYEEPEELIGTQIISGMFSLNCHYNKEIRKGRIRKCTEEEGLFLAFYFRT